MSFINRIKQTANDVVSSAQEGINRGQAQLGGMQNRSAANDLWRTLGQAYFVHLEGRATDEQLQAVVAAVLPRIREYEQTLGLAPFPTVADAGGQPGAGPAAGGAPGPGGTPPTFSPPS